MTDDDLYDLAARLRGFGQLTKKAKEHAADAIEALMAERDEARQVFQMAHREMGNMRFALLARAERAEAALRPFGVYLVLDSDSDTGTLPVLVRDIRRAHAVLDAFLTQIEKE